MESPVHHIKPRVLWVDIGPDHSYESIWKLQADLQSDLIRAKKNGSLHHHYLILSEHPPVYTLGKSGDANHLLNSGIDHLPKPEFFKINRGGDITFHGPGQITGYPILDLDYFYHDLHRYVRNIEEVLIRVLSEYDIDGIRIPGYTGVWADRGNQQYVKLCAIGIHMSRWVSMHGFAVNVNTNLDYFSGIIPCGISENGYDVSSIAQLCGKQIEMMEVRDLIRHHFQDVFQVSYIN